MKKSVCTLLVVLTTGNLTPLVAAPLVAPSFDAPTSSLKTATPTEAKAFRQLYAKSDAATSRRDLSWAKRYITDDFLFRYRSGLSLDKAQFLQLDAAILRRTIKVNSARTRVERIGMQRNLATVIATSTTDMTYRGLDKRVHRSVSTSQTMDTWILLKAGWRLQTAQELATSSTVDGQIYPPVAKTAQVAKTPQVAKPAAVKAPTSAKTPSAAQTPTATETP